MDKEITFNNKQEEIYFRQELAKEVIAGNFDIVPSHNLESRSFSFLENSIYRNKESTEYFKLSTSDYSSTKGTWVKVREVKSKNPLQIRSNYRFAAQLGGNYGLAGRIILNVRFLRTEGDLKVNIKYHETNLNQYIKTSVEFGLLYAIDTMQPFKKLEGEYDISVEGIGFHEIDSSAATMAYTSNMALRRAFDKENMHNSFLFESGKFSLHKKYPNHKAYR